MALGAVAVTVVTWASSFAAIRVGLIALSPIELAAARYLSSAAFAGAYLVLVRPLVPTLAEFVRLAAAGVLFVACYAVFLNTGEMTVKAGPASFILQINPIFVALAAIPLLGEKFGLWSWFGTFVSFAGIGLIALGGEGHLTFEFGALLVLGSAASVAAASILQKPLLARFPATTVTAWLLFLGALPLIPVLPESFAALGAAPPNVFWAVAWMVVMPTLVGYLTWAVALKRMPAGRASNFLYTIAPTALLIGYVWLGEVPSVTAIIGGVLAVAGVVVVNLSRGR